VDRQVEIVAVVVDAGMVALEQAVLDRPAVEREDGFQNPAFGVRGGSKSTQRQPWRSLKNVAISASVEASTGGCPGRE